MVLSGWIFSVRPHESIHIIKIKDTVGDLEKLLEPQNAEPETPESSSSILNNLTLFSIVLN